MKDANDNYKSVHETAVASMGGQASLTRAAHGAGTLGSWFKGNGLIIKVLAAQMGFAFVAATTCWLWKGDIWGYSAIWGGLACVIPNAFLGVRLMLPRPANREKALLRAAYLGELGKLALMVAICAAVFSLVRPLSGAAFFIGFIATQAATLSGLLMNSGYPKYLMDQTNGR